MPMPKILLDVEAFGDGQDPYDVERFLYKALEALTQYDLAYLHAHPKTPTLYQSGVRYVRDPVGVERWRGTDSLLRDLQGDCKSLAAMRMAELRHAGEKAQFLLRKKPIGEWIVYHVQVLRADQSVEDPSAMLGMTDAFAPPGRPQDVRAAVSGGFSPRVAAFFRQILGFTPKLPPPPPPPHPMQGRPGMGLAPIVGHTPTYFPHPLAPVVGHTPHNFQHPLAGMMGHQPTRAHPQAQALAPVVGAAGVRSFANYALGATPQQQAHAQAQAQAQANAMRRAQAQVAAHNAQLAHNARQQQVANQALAQHQARAHAQAQAQAQHAQAQARHDQATRAARAAAVQTAAQRAAAMHRQMQPQNVRTAMAQAMQPPPRPPPPPPMSRGSGGFVGHGAVMGAVRGGPPPEFFTISGQAGPPPAGTGLYTIAGGPGDNRDPRLVLTGCCI